MSNQYAFVTRWRIAGTCGEIADVLSDPLALPRWWPSVYLRVDETRPPDASGLHRRVRLQTKGWLPYTLTWEFELVESRYPYGFVLVASGDFDGRGVWRFEQDGAFVDVIYDWRLSAEKPLLRHLGFVFRPLFEANHRWAMGQGEESLKLELARRRATSDAALATIPPPPGPVTYAGVALLGGAVAVVAGLGYLLLRSRRQPRSARNRQKARNRSAMPGGPEGPHYY